MDENITYLFLMHLISGIGQSRQGKPTSTEFAQINFGQCFGLFRNIDTVKAKFFENEKASQFGKLRIQMFLFLMKYKKYKLAGKIMELK